MFFEGLVNSQDIQVMERTLAFTRAKHRLHAENIANAVTPNYRARHLDGKAFQNALREALDGRSPDSIETLVLPNTRQIQSSSDGRLAFRPTVAPPQNLLFHDGTNLSIEREMSDMAENALTQQLATEMLKKSYDMSNKAIFGQLI